jgi:alpha-glucoside transport system permease protein
MAVSSRSRTGSQGENIDLTQFFTSLGLLAATLFILWWGFLFLRDTKDLNPLLLAVIAIVWGVGGVALFFISINRLIESFGESVRRWVQPFAFIGPALVLLVWFMLLPVMRTAYLSVFDADSQNFVWLSNFGAVFTDRQMRAAFGNNLLWMVIGTSFSVGLGLFIAVLADRSKFERLAKSIIFMPMAISFVGASLIWKFVYYYQPPGEPQTGLLNAIITGFGVEPQAWISDFQPWNNLFLIVILIWMQSGYAMVIFSAALKGVPEDLIEAGRIDGANEGRIFFNIIMPYIKGTIITVGTTILIFTLKIFDVVITMTGGQYNTEVIAIQFYRQFFQYRNFGYGSAIAMVLLIAVIPVMAYNLRQLAKQEGFK